MHSSRSNYGRYQGTFLDTSQGLRLSCLDSHTSLRPSPLNTSSHLSCLDSHTGMRPSPLNTSYQTNPSTIYQTSRPAWNYGAVNGFATSDSYYDEKVDTSKIRYEQGIQRAEEMRRRYEQRRQGVEEMRRRYEQRRQGVEEISRWYEQRRQQQENERRQIQEEMKRKREEMMRKQREHIRRKCQELQERAVARYQIRKVIMESKMESQIDFGVFQEIGICLELLNNITNYPTVENFSKTAEQTHLNSLFTLTAVECLPTVEFSQTTLPIWKKYIRLLYRHPKYAVKELVEKIDTELIKNWQKTFDFEPDFKEIEFCSACKIHKKLRKEITQIYQDVSFDVKSLLTTLDSANLEEMKSKITMTMVENLKSKKIRHRMKLINSPEKITEAITDTILKSSEEYSYLFSVQCMIGSLKKMIIPQSSSSSGSSDG